MANYEESLRSLIEEQVVAFISKVMKDEWTVDNGGISADKESGTGRTGQLMGLKDPRYASPLNDDGTSKLYPNSADIRAGVQLNSNPLFQRNMIDRLNTPFDHIERILLQDFSDTMDIGGDDDYFKGMFNFTRTDNVQFTNGFKKIVLNEGDGKTYSGEFFVDSFTYTPFIDYSLDGQGGDSGIGIYSDEFLNDYNTGKYEARYIGVGKKEQVDGNRGTISSNLYRLGNLQKDIEDAKVAFRNAVKWEDSAENRNVYIYTFCEHIANLFAKLSNIRMCHEIYGFKHPHAEWEGILALDIWYQLLYRNIDEKYPFDDRYFNMNPMSRYRILKKNGNDVIEYNGKMVSVEAEGRSTVLPDGRTVTWMEKDGLGYVLVWDQSMFNAYVNNADDVREKRANLVTPRGVLGVIDRILNTDELSEICDRDSGDFEWFFQKGKVYSDSSKSIFTKYVNLHLGRAWDAMTGKQYCDLCGKEPVVAGSEVQWRKPGISEVQDRPNLFVMMLKKGYGALKDAFEVVKDERLTNVYKSDGTVEMFDSDNADQYSQAQCAIAIERIFSRIYKYLQFKSTTGEVFQRHVNIDSGYKYLTSETLEKNDNGNSRLYFQKDDRDDSPGYLRYLEKLEQYAGINPLVEIGLSDDEKTILEKFIAILAKKAAPWIDWKWNLCPLCIENQIAEGDYGSQGTMRKRAPQSRADGDAEDDDTLDVVNRSLVVDFNLNPHMEWSAADVIVPDGCQLKYDSSGRPLRLEFSATNDGFGVDLSQLSFNGPCYVDSGSGLTAHYTLVGYAAAPNAVSAQWSVDDVIDMYSFGGGNFLHIYAVWIPEYIVKFNAGESDAVQDGMASYVVSSGQTFNAPANGFAPPTQKRVPFLYHDSPMVDIDGTGEKKLWKDVASNNSTQDELDLYGFAGWKCEVGGLVMGVKEGQEIQIDEKPYNGVPVVTLTAKWEQKYSNVVFTVYGYDYCEVLVSTTDNKLVHPGVDPEILVDDKLFSQWKVMEGTILTEIGTNLDVVCGESTTPTDILCGESSDPGDIVCQSEGMVVSGVKVAARIADARAQKFNVVFKYLKIDNEQVKNVEKQQATDENTYIPEFHIHHEFKHGGFSYVFRYWKLESGNLTSSFTVMSDCVFTAVYDKIKVPQGDRTDVQTVGGTVLLDPHKWNDSEKLRRCDWLKTLSGGGGHYCSYIGIDPKSDGGGRVAVNCPYFRINEFLKKEEGDFAPITFIEIEDVENLLKALFKVNIHIAHTEYYLKIDIPEKSDWWYGQKIGDEENEVICDGSSTNTVCEGGETTQIVCFVPGLSWISYEPTVEFKFSNLHAANQVENGKLLCTCNLDDGGSKVWITPVNRELLEDAENGKGLHFNELLYCHDYFNSLVGHALVKTESSADTYEEKRVVNLSDRQNYYSINKLHLYDNTIIQSPTDVNGFVKTRKNEIVRTNRQVQTFTSIVKKYRPVVMPKVRDIFNDCVNDKTKYEVDRDNDYGVFGWCTIPSKTMVNMEYNEDSLIVPSSYDHHNRIGGSNFLQMDSDLDGIYRTRIGSAVVQNAQNTWYYLYNTRDWTYFLLPFFNVKRNSDLYSYMLDTYPPEKRPENSNHINGVIFEPSNQGRAVDASFGKMADTCRFLAKYHHGEKNLKNLAERFTNMVPYSKLRELTAGDSGFNSVYGSQYDDITDDFNFPKQDWVDDYDKTGSYIDSGKYTYNLGQAHAIDDFDEDSVWFYITMVEPVENLEQVIELQDIMPFVMWWENRGYENNGPTVNCYGRPSSAKLNYEKGGWCYSGAMDRIDQGKMAEQKWHAVQHTFGVDFSKKENGGTVLTSDNSGNVYKGAFDPNCAGTDEKWKVHGDTPFGTNQHEDPAEDKYYTGYTAHGEGEFRGKKIADGFNEEIMGSLQDRPMTWNLWNVVRHYVYIRHFKNRNRTLPVDDQSAWQELEQMTRKVVKGIYRTFWQNCKKSGKRLTFTDVDQSSTYYGGRCYVPWTNSFVEIQSILEPNARQHEASLVMFTGDIRGNDVYSRMRKSRDNFRVVTFEGADSDEDGMAPRQPSITGETLNGWNYSGDSDAVPTIYQGYKFEDMPQTYIVGDTVVCKQQSSEREIHLATMINLDDEYPYCEYYRDDKTRKWLRTVSGTIMNTQLFPVYTSMETMNIEPHNLTDADMKSITFQVVPQLYWKYEWTFNDYMIHRVGKLNAPSREIPMYDMLGNVWELVRDDWNATVHGRDTQKNPIEGKSDDTSPHKTIKGGAFDQFCRKTISPSRESIGRDQCRSEKGTQANVGFRPALEFTADSSSSFTVGSTPVDLFFLFDASSSQNDQITKMIESSVEIIKMFAGTGEANKHICNVGSALFLGPNIRMMCGIRQDDITQRMFVTCPRIDADGTELWCSAWNPQAQKQFMEDYRTEYKKAQGRGEIPDDVAGVYRVLRQKYLERRSAYMESTKDIMDGFRGVSALNQMPMLRSGSVGPSSVAGGDYGHGLRYGYKYWEYEDYHMFPWRGCGVWMEDGLLKFEEGKRFFTYDPYSEGPNITTFNNPFLQSKSGVLTNWFSGCESVCDVLATLLHDGYFGGYFPWVPAVGYMFRHSDIPKLVFVYSNEFDNELTRGYYSGKVGITPAKFRFNTTHLDSIVAVPGVANNVVQFGVANVKYTDYDGTSQFAKYPLDPYCMKFSNRAASERYVNRLGVGSDPSVLSALVRQYDGVGWFESNVGTHSKTATVNSHAFLASVSGLNLSNPPGSIKSIAKELDFAQRNPDGVLKPSPQNIDGVRKILMDEQVDELLGHGKFPGVIYGTGGALNKIEQDWAMTVGFYRLRNQVSKLTKPVNTFMFVSNADAPRLIKDSERTIAFLHNDRKFFDQIRGKSLPLAISLKVNELCPSGLSADNKAALGYKSSSSTWTFATLVYMNMVYLYYQFGKSNDYELAKKICTVFGDMHNPYTSTKIIWGIRKHGNSQDFKASREALTMSSRWKPFYRYVVCLPWDGSKTTGKTDSKVKNLIKGYTLAQARGILGGGSGQGRIWSYEEWDANTNNCRMSLTVDTGDLYTMYVQFAPPHAGNPWTESDWSSFVDADVREIDSLFITDLISPLSIRFDRQRYYLTNFGDYYNPYAFSKNMVLDDCITIRYNTSETDPLGTGILRIVSWTSREQPEKKHIWHPFSEYEMAKEDGQELLPKTVFETITKTDTTEYPKLWKKSVAAIAKHEYARIDGNNPGITSTSVKNFANALFTDPVISGFVYAIYDNIAKAEPMLLARRYQENIFDRIRNNCNGGMSVTDYEAEGNCVIFKALPVMHFDEAYTIFSNSFSVDNFTGGGFSYRNCVVDLNPPGYDVPLPDGAFPMSFTEIENVNKDEYKTSKLVFTRIDGISATNFSSFTMGSRATDYDKVDNALRIKYKDDDSIVDGAKNDNAAVTLGNGGGFQKKRVDIKEKDVYNPSTEPLSDDLYWIPEDPASATPEAIVGAKKKFKKNRHFFIDPFELTIAQWCHVHGWHDKTAARSGLASAADKADFNEMRRSYFKYLQTFEPAAWGDLVSTWNIPTSDVPDEIVDALVEKDATSRIYNPLEDTRPYYYATYNNVRGTGQVYDKRFSLASRWRDFVIDQNLGDEFQMVSRIGSAANQSFLDLLNRNVVTYARTKTYNDNSVYGLREFDVEAYNGDRSKSWQRGESAGINFDLPTEAQWEYCCRLGSNSAFPINNDLGDNFEEHDENLDLIAWYKYKVIGSKPEPEKYCTWRISRMLFGVTRDKELVNSVYESL